MSGNHVLIIEDDEATRNLLATVAQHYGFDARTAADGHAALGELRANEFDVVLVDLLLPRLNGFELLRHIKCTHPEMLSRTIVVTAASEMTTGDCGELRSVWRMMQKPIDVEALATEMMSCVAGRRQPSLLRRATHAS